MASLSKERQLLDAAKAGDPRKVKQLLSSSSIFGSKIDVNTKLDGSTPLHWATEKGHVEVVKELLRQAKINVNIENNNGSTPLYSASYNGHVEVVKVLLRHAKIDVNIKDKYGSTPLYWASSKGHVEVVKELLRHAKIGVNIKNKYGSTQLHWASEEGHVKVVKELLRHAKIGVNIKNKYGSTPLHLASEKGHVEVVKELLRHAKIDVKIENNNGSTPLHLASEKGHAEVVKELLGHAKVDIKIKDKDGSTPLHLASEKGHVEVVKEFLLRHANIDVTIKDKDGSTPLHLASEEGHVEVVKEFLSRHAKIDVIIKDNDGNSALDVAKDESIRAEIRQYVKIREEKENLVLQLKSLDAIQLELTSLRTQLKEISNSGQQASGAAIDMETLALLVDIEKYSQVFGVKTINDMEISISQFREAKRKKETEMHNAANQGNLTLVRELQSHVNEIATKLGDAEKTLQNAKEVHDRKLQQLLQLSSQEGSCNVEEEISKSRKTLKAAMDQGVSEDNDREVEIVSVSYLKYLTQKWSLVIDAGSQGIVYRGIDEKLNALVAVKEFPVSLANTNVRPAFERELDTLSSLRHPNVIKILAKSATKRKFYIVYEYAAGGSLSSALEAAGIAANQDISVPSFKWQRRAQAAVSLAHALNHCHKHGVVHRDVKPDNVCFKDQDYRELCLLDFGIATTLDGTATSFGQTPLYSPDEYRPGERFGRRQESYSYGVVLIAMITGKTSGPDLKALKRGSRETLKQQADAGAGDWDSQVLDELCKIAFYCVGTKPSKRPTFDYIVGRLSVLESKMATRLTSAQKTALSDLPKRATRKTKKTEQKDSLCPCGNLPTLGLKCAEGHVMCNHCLHETVKSQLGADAFCCHIGSCKAVFRVPDVVGIVDDDLLGDHAETLKRSKQTQDREDEFKKQMGEMMSAFQGQRDLLGNMAAKIASKRIECPSLVVLFPFKTGRFSAKKVFCNEYMLHFLCAHDRAHATSYILVTKSRGWVKKVAPVLKYSIMALKLLSASQGIPLPINIPGSTFDGKIGSLVDSLKDVLDEADYDGWMDTVEDIMEDGNLGEEHVRALLCQGAHEIDAAAHASIAKLANEHPKWKDEMSFEANRQGDCAWVLKRNVEAWKRGNNNHG